MLLLKSVTVLPLCLAFVVMRFSLNAGSTVEDDEVQCRPQHVHLSLGEVEGQMTVMWATNGTCDTASVLYGTSQWLTATDAAAAQPRSVTSRQQVYTEHNANGLHGLHKAVLKDLEGSKTYFYRPISQKIGAGPFYFQAPPHGSDWSPELLVVGDLGTHLELLPQLTEEALSGQYTAVLQLGGLSPFLADANGTKGDMLMEGLEHMAAFIPVMTAPGHNETAAGQFPGYRHRFSMPGSWWPMREDQLWYSFNLGPTHFVSLCTDVYLRGNLSLQTLQKQWLVKDLSQANMEREKQPWIVAFGYHSLYCAGDGNSDRDCAKTDSLVRQGLEETLYYYGVDLILMSGPQSSYERFYPLFKGVMLSNNYTNPRAPIHIVSGTSGDNATTNTAVAADTTASPVAKPPVTSLSPSVKADGELPNGSKSETSSSSSSESSSSSSGGSSGSSSSDGSSGSSSNNVKSKRSAEVKGIEASGKEAQTLTAFKFVNGTRPTYGRLRILNATHAQWELVAGSTEEVGSENEEGKVLDSVLLVQEHHGKFKLSELPHDVEQKIDENLVASGGRPGVLNVHDPVLENKIMLATDDSRRLIIGVSFGGVVLIIAVIAVIIKVRSRVKRRSVRRWDVMDYKYGKTKLYTPTNDEEEDQEDHDFEMDIADGSMQTKKLINGK